MDDLHDRLERLIDRFEAEPDPMRKLERARTRRARSRKISTVALALVVGLAGTLGVVNAFGRDRSQLRSDLTYPKPPNEGYYIVFPDQAVRTNAESFGAKVVARSNLPEGTVYSTSVGEFGATIGVAGGSGGSCCPAIEGGDIRVAVGNQSCYGLVGDIQIGASTGFEITITVEPRPAEGQVFPGIGEWEPPDQPPAVVRELGERFDRLIGDQVKVRENGDRVLIATARFRWPLPQCRGDSLPLFGGPNCPATEGQLQGHDLDDAMGEVMGTLSQGRMCEFWGLMLPTDVSEEHPWPEFAAQWRVWLEQQDFSDAVSDASWSVEPFTWHAVDRRAEVRVVEVTNHGVSILRLDLVPLPDYCPDCTRDVVPFWGVTGWDFLQ